MMMKVMIVEDELLVRTGLRTLVKWEENGFLLSAEAGNGEEALKILSNEKIDIIITDIRMPVMDGLKLIEEIRKRKLECEIIVLSSYDEFQYVKKAMVLGAKDYIHKPTMMPEDIILALKKVRDEIKESRSTNSYKLLIEQNVNESNTLLLEKVVRRCITEGDISSEICHLLVNSGLGDKQYYVFMFKLLYKKYGNIEGVNRLKGESALREAIEKIKSFDLGCLWCLKEQEYWLVLMEEKCHLRITDELESTISGLEGIELVSSVSESEYFLKNIGESINKVKYELDEEFRRRDWMSSLSSISALAIELISKNYTKNITLKDVANSIHVNSSYLSRLFIREIGSSFVDYVTDLRMKHAKMLLKETKLTVSIISERVGYQNEKYFMKLFKKLYGCTSGEYREAKLK